MVFQLVVVAIMVDVQLPVSGIQCPHRGAVFSYHSRHVLFPYEQGDREACNIFFVWEMLRPLLKGKARGLRFSGAMKGGRGSAFLQLAAMGTFSE